MNIIVSPEPPTLMIGINQTDADRDRRRQDLREPAHYDFDLKPMPGLAKSWSVSPDGLTYTFKLQENVKWHDGKPFTAADVVFTAQEILVEVHPRSRPVMQRAEDVDATDPHTVVFKLKEPFGAVPHGWVPSTAPIVPKHIYDGTDFRTNPANQTPVGTGPFKLKEWVRGPHIHFVRNDDYWKQGQPYLDGIYLPRPARCRRRASSRMETGQAHLSAFADIEPFEVARLKALPHLEATTKGYEFLSPMMWIDFNTAQAAAQRQALPPGADVTRWTATSSRTASGSASARSRPARSHSSTRYYDAKVANLSVRRPQGGGAARRNGPKRGAGRRARHPDSRPPALWRRVKRLAEYIKQALCRVGVDLTIRDRRRATWVDRVNNWDYQLTHPSCLSQFGRPGARRLAPLHLDQHPQGAVQQRQRLFESAHRRAFRQGADRRRRGRPPADVQRDPEVLVDDVPVAWILELDFPTFINKQFKNVVTSSIGVRDTFADVYMVPQK